MKKEKKKTPQILHRFRIICLLICTIIGGYGILQAPESDRNKMEQELKQNELALQQMETDISTDTPAEPDGTSIADKNGVTGENTNNKNTQKTDSLSVIGDSIFLGAAPAFREYYENAVIDAKISRQVCQALEAAKKLEKKGKLGNTVIIALGINGNFNPATGQALIDYLGPERKIYWINAYGADRDIQKKVNPTIKKLAETNQNVHLIPWAEEAKSHPDWFYQDGTHLNSKGQKGYARFVKQELEK